MGLVDDQEPMMAVGQFSQFGQRRSVAIHRIEAFNRDPGMSGSASLAPVADGLVERADVVVRDRDGLGPAGRDARMCACVNQRVMHDNVAALRQGREDGHIGCIAAAEKQCAFGSEERGCFRFQCFVLGMIAAQQARSAGADGDAAGERAGDGGVETC